MTFIVVAHELGNYALPVNTGEQIAAAAAALRTAGLASAPVYSGDPGGGDGYPNGETVFAASAAAGDEAAALAESCAAALRTEGWVGGGAEYDLAHYPGDVEALGALLGRLPERQDRLAFEGAVRAALDASDAVGCTYSIFDSDPQASSGTVWPGHDQADLGTADPDQAAAAVRRLIREGTYSEADGYEPGDRIHYLVWAPDGTLVRSGSVAICVD